MNINSNRFLFAGNKADSTITVSLASKNSFTHIQPKKGYSCICLKVSNTSKLEGVNVVLQNSANVVFAYDERGEIHSRITTENCGGIVPKSETFVKTYYIESDEISKISLRNMNSVDGAIDVAVSYLKSMPQHLCALKPIQILYSEPLTVEGNKVTVPLYLDNEICEISKFFKYLMFRAKFYDSAGAEKTTQSTLKVYPYNYFVNKTQNISNVALSFNTESFSFDNVKAVASSFVENRFTDGIRMELTGNALAAGDTVVLQVVGVR